MLFTEGRFMMHERRWLWRLLGVTLGMAMLLCALSSDTAEAQSKRRSEPQKHDSALEGKPAPQFLLSDIYGIPRRLSGWRGMPIFLHFGSSW